jgi:enoyl-CoA hydratase/carnithine racemase
VIISPPEMTFADFLDHPPTSDDSTVAAFLSAIHNFSKPLIIAVKGNAVGVGTTMLLHADIVVAGESAKFSLPFTSLGLVPEAGSSFLLPRMIGHHRAAELFFISVIPLMQTMQRRSASQKSRRS